MRRTFFRPLAALLAAAGSVFGGMTTAPTWATNLTRSMEQGATARQQTDRAPAPTATVAANQSLGIIDAPDFRSYRTYVPIWVGRPRSRYGRQYGPRV